MREILPVFSMAGSWRNEMSDHDGGDDFPHRGAMPRKCLSLSKTHSTWTAILVKPPPDKRAVSLDLRDYREVIADQDPRQVASERPRPAGSRDAVPVSGGSAPAGQWHVVIGHCGGHRGDSQNGHA